MTTFRTNKQENDKSQADFYREDAYLRAQKKVKKIIGFYWHLAAYVIINLFFIVFLGSNNGDFFSFGNFSMAIFWDDLGWASGNDYSLRNVLLFGVLVDLSFIVGIWFLDLSRQFINSDGFFVEWRKLFFVENEKRRR